MNKQRVLQIALQQRQKVCVYNAKANRTALDLTVADFKRIGVLINEAAELGFAFSNRALNAVIYDADMELLSTTMIDTLRQMVGAHVNHNPMYKNFPISVMEMSDEELIVNQIVGYMCDGLDYCFDGEMSFRDTIAFDGPTRERMPLTQDVELKVIDVMTIDQFYGMFTNLMSRPAALNDTEKDLLREFLAEMPNAVEAIPDHIPFKETLILVVDVVANFDDAQTLPLHSATDVLRFAVYSYCDDEECSMDSMKRGITFGKISRKDKRLILNTLNTFSVEQLSEDISRYKETFKKLLYQCDLFSQRYRNKYDKLKKLMTAVYEHERLSTYNSKVAEAFKTDNFNGALTLLCQREGEFIRHLMQLVRLAYNNPEHKDDYIIRIGDCIERCGKKASTKLLWDLVGYFDSRLNGERRIAFIAKTNTLKVLEDSQEIDDDTLKYLQAKVLHAITSQYAQRPAMGYVCMDKGLDRYMLNVNAKGTNNNSEGFARGTRYVFGEGNFIRPFIYWRNPSDVDLSMTLLDESFDYVDHCSWTHGRTKNAVMVHSGDITNGSRGASEFVDIDIKNARKLWPTVRYAVVQVHSYSGDKFEDMEECFVGVMVRDDQIEGKIFEPKTVDVKFNLKSARTSCAAAVVDLIDRELYIADIPLGKNTAYGSVETSGRVTSLIADYIVHYHKPSIDEVMTLNVISRSGTFVHEVERTITHEDDNGKPISETVTVYETTDGKVIDPKDILFIGFDPTKGLTPKDNDKIVAEYL